MKIEQLKIDQLIPYEFNNRVHSDEQVNLIANSINQFGFNQPIVIDEANIILVGHGRLEAAKKLGLKTVPTFKIAGLTEAQKKAYRILDNKLQNDSEWDFENLKIELDNLEDAGFELEEWGLDDLLKLAPVKEENEVFEDGGPGELPEEPFIKIGDVIELGPHRVMCGDSTKEEDVRQLRKGITADLFITDPPYGVSYANKNRFLNAISRGNSIQESIENDGRTPEEMKEFWELAFKTAHDATSDSASYYIFGPQGGDLMMMMMSIKDANWQLKHMLVWVKNNHVLGRSDYHYKHEPIWFGWKAGKTHKFYGNSSQVSVWEFNKPQKSNLHPTMKPIELIGKAICNSSKTEDVILDLFLGSGTTLIAADQLNRICYGMEISPKYCQVILERYIKYRQDAGKDVKIKINGEDFDPKSINL